MSLDQGAAIRPPAAELSAEAAQLGKQIEIVHAAGADIIINHDADLAGQARRRDLLGRVGCAGAS